MQLMDPTEPPTAPEILVLRALKLGDLLVAVPAIHGIRRALPEHRLILAMSPWLAPIIDLVDGVDALLPTPGLNSLLPVPAGRVDIAANLHGNGPESRTVVQALEARLTIAHRPPGTLASLRLPGTPPAWAPEWQDGVLERRRWCRLVGAYGIAADPNDVALRIPEEPTVVPGATVVHVGAFYGSRHWPIERFAAVAAWLESQGHRVVFTGSVAERERARAVAELAGMPESAVLAGTITLREFAALVASAHLVLSADTGAAHLASAYGIPSVTIFGPAPPEEWGPPPGPHRVLTYPHLRQGLTFSSEPDPALLAVTERDVLEAIASLSGDVREDGEIGAAAVTRDQADRARS